MQLPSSTPTQTQYLNRQMNNLTGSSFIEVFRKNDKTKRNVVSIRERRNVVKEILVYNNNNLNGSILYFNGEFDPAMVRELAEKNKFDAISNGLLGKVNPQTPGITND
jgi:lipid II:glycine glycyltransferase (peptidoglycan interpeptide bridge formation enzyme)